MMKAKSRYIGTSIIFITYALLKRIRHLQCITPQCLSYKYITRTAVRVITLRWLKMVWFGACCLVIWWHMKHHEASFGNFIKSSLNVACFNSSMYMVKYRGLNIALNHAETPGKNIRCWLLRLLMPYCHITGPSACILLTKWLWFQDSLTNIVAVYLAVIWTQFNIGTTVTARKSVNIW